jgi:leucyl-tRNA---protein transferase
MESSRVRDAVSVNEAERSPADEAVDPLELTVHDEISPCPYLPEMAARMPLRVPLRPLTQLEFDRRLASGHRRHGRLLYRTQCPECRACEPIRLVVGDFTPGRTQRRVLRRGERVFDVEIGPPATTREKVVLYNEHKHGRGLMRDDGPLGAAGYEAFLVDTCCETFEMRYRVQGRLIGVAVVDRGFESLSAVYSFYEPEYEPLSPGVFSILKQIELCRAWELRYLYLGLYVEQCSHLAYKGHYLPHERLIDGRWQRFDR